MDGAGPTVFERIEQKLSKMGIAVDNADIREASRQVEARLEANPNDTESKINRLELKVVELARLLDASLGALENNGVAVHETVQPKAQLTADQVEEQLEHAGSAEQAQAQLKQAAPKKVKRMLQNPATGIIEEVEVEDRPQDHFIVADGHGGGTLPGRRVSSSDDDGLKAHKKPVFIAAADDEPVRSSEKKR